MTAQPIVYLRRMYSGTDNACWVLCAKGEPGAVPFAPYRGEPLSAGSPGHTYGGPSITATELTVFDGCKVDFSKLKDSDA